MRGFTLIELLITVAIVAALASIALPLSEVAATRNKEHELRRALRDIRDALDAYKKASDEGRIARVADQSGYPPGLITLVQGTTDLKSTTGKRIYFLRKLPRDPARVAHALARWAAEAERTYGPPPLQPYTVDFVS